MPRKPPSRRCALPMRRPTRNLPNCCAMSSDSATPTVKVFFREAIARALIEEMSRGSPAIVRGQDVGRFGGSDNEFLGLYERFGAARVRDTPVAEASMIGVGV